MEFPSAPTGGASPWRDFPRNPGMSVRRLRRAGRASRAFAVLAVAGLVAIASVAFLIGLSWVRSQGAVRVVQAQIEAIRQGKVEEAYALFSREYQAGMSLPMFRRWLRRQRRLSSVEHLDFWGRSVWGQTALLWGSFQDDLGHSYPVRYLLVQENGGWRIDRFLLSAEIPDPPPQPERFVTI